MENIKINYDKNGRVILNSELMIQVLLDSLFEEDIINESTYNRAKQE